MAEIVKRGNGYQIIVFLGRDDTGKKIRETVTYIPESTAPIKAKKEAEAFAAEFEKKVKSGKYIKDTKLTFTELVELWKDSESFANLSIACQEDYQRVLKNWFIPSIGSIHINDISAVHLESIYNRMRKEGKAKTTIKRAHCVVSSVIKYAYRKKMIEDDIISRVDLPKIEKNTQLTYFDIEQSKRFLEALHMTYEVPHKAHTRIIKETGQTYEVPEYTQKVIISSQFIAYFTLALFSGFRRGEMIALTWNDIDFDNKTVTISKAMSSTRSQGQIEKSPKTKSGYRTLKLPSEVFESLKAWKSEQKALYIKVGTMWRGFRGHDFDKNHVFIRTDNECGKVMYLDTPYSKLKEIIQLYNSTVTDDRDKLPDIRLHDLRHVSASLMISQNVDIETISRRMGHAETSTTLNIYGHAFESLDESASDTLENLLSAR